MALLERNFAVSVGGALAALMLVFEVSAFALATFKVGLSASKAGSTWLGRKNSLQSLLFRQGLMYILYVNNYYLGFQRR